jgi:hypothetical protein
VVGGGAAAGAGGVAVPPAWVRDKDGAAQLVKPLCKAIVSVLIAEAKALKWYPSHACHYMDALVERLRAIAANGCVQCMLRVVSTEAADIEGGLLSMPSHGGGVPGECSLSAKWCCRLLSALVCVLGAICVSPPPSLSLPLYPSLCVEIAHIG